MADGRKGGVGGAHPGMSLCAVLRGWMLETMGSPLLVRAMGVCGPSNSALEGFSYTPEAS